NLVQAAPLTEAAGNDQTAGLAGRLISQTRHAALPHRTSKTWHGTESAVATRRNTRIEFIRAVVARKLFFLAEADEGTDSSAPASPRARKWSFSRLRKLLQNATKGSQL